jgi:bile acid-coenzyme A ligase
MGEAMAYHAHRDPDRIAVLCDGDGAISRQELESQANRTARALGVLGVGAGDFVTLAMPNSIDFYVAAFACWKLGAVPQPVSSRLPPPELRALVELAQPAVVLGVDSLPGVRSPVLPLGWSADTALSDEPLEPVVGGSWKAMPSGGSTGRPKIVVSKQRAETRVDAPTAGMSLDGVQLVCGPLYHNGPFSFSMSGLFSGATIVLMRRFDASRALELIEHYRVDWVFLVPTMMHRIWRLPQEERLGRDLSSLNMVLSVGAPWPVWLKEEWIHWLGPERIIEIYGGTESQGSTMLTGAEALAHPGSVGRPSGATQLRILDEDGRDLPAHAVGEIYFHHEPGSIYEYIGGEARTRGDGWETLGDLGWLDEEGYLYIADRRSDLIVVGGVNVYPAEVEAALSTHPRVRSCAVIGLPDEDLGQSVHAIVDVGPGPTRDVSEEELRGHLAGLIAPTKVPRTFEVVDELLRNDAGKVNRSALRAVRVPASPG